MKSQNPNPKNILITPLGWGLGHASRMIPLALKLQDLGNNIIIAGNEECLALFRKETSGMTLILFPGFNMRYSSFLPSYICILLKIPALIYHSFRDHIKLKSIISNYKIDIVISDNRFGCWNKNVKSVYITHQLRIKFPAPFSLLEPLGIGLHRIIINKYDLCFIPDVPGEANLSGDLSHNIKLPSNTSYIGLLSRFGSNVDTNLPVGNMRPYTTLLLSGPEPQKSILRKKLTYVLKRENKSLVIFEGAPGDENKVEEEEKLISYNHLPSEEMKEIILQSENIICRAGYTTIMELVSLNRTALLIPTPGQTEQEYLAKHLVKMGWFRSADQNGIIMSELMPGSKADLPAYLAIKSEELLSLALTKISE